MDVGIKKKGLSVSLLRAVNKGLAELLSELQSVDEESPEAEENETTISDNNGGRIELGDKPDITKVIRKT